MKNNSMFITIALLVIVGAGAFFGGMKYQEGKTSASSGLSGDRETRNGRTFMGNRTGARPVTGEILSSDSSSVTVKLQDGSTKIVLFSDKTSISKGEKVSASDLKTGEKVAAFGQENSDGSLTAQSIQINPILRIGGSPTPSAAK